MVKNMLKKILKRFMPLPAKKQNDQFDFLKRQNEKMISEMKIITNHYRQKSLEVTEADYSAKLKDWYFVISGGKELNLENPRLFCEKLNWLKLYDRNPMKSLLADKYLAPKYVNYITQGKLKTSKCLGVWENAWDIDFRFLPNKFVLKCNHGSSMNIIVNDKNKLNIVEAVQKLNGWLSTNYTIAGGCFELQYQDIKPRIIAQEFLDDGHSSLQDYKFHCFNGEPKFIEVQSDHYEGRPVSQFLDLDWKKLDIKRKDWYEPLADLEKPKRLPEMLEFARFLSKNFIYVRMDFYYVNDEIYFGEYTFSPAAGWFNFERPETDAELGKLLSLPTSKQNIDGEGHDI